MTKATIHHPAEGRREGLAAVQRGWLTCQWLPLSYDVDPKLYNALQGST